MKKLLRLLTVSAVVILLLASAATAQDYTQGRDSADPPNANTTKDSAQPREPCSSPLRKTRDPSLATSFAPVALVSVRPPCTHYLIRTGGPPLVATLLLLCSVIVMVGSSVVIVVIRVVLRQ